MERMSVPNVTNEFFTLKVRKIVEKKKANDNPNETKTNVFYKLEKRSREERDAILRLIWCTQVVLQSIRQEIVYNSNDMLRVSSFNPGLVEYMINASEAVMVRYTEIRSKQKYRSNKKAILLLGDTVMKENVLNALLTGPTATPNPRIFRLANFVIGSTSAVAKPRCTTVNGGRTSQNRAGVASAEIELVQLGTPVRNVTAQDTAGPLSPEQTVQVTEHTQHKQMVSIETEQETTPNNTDAEREQAIQHALCKIAMQISTVPVTRRNILFSVLQIVLQAAPVVALMGTQLYFFYAYVPAMNINRQRQTIAEMFQGAVHSIVDGAASIYHGGIKWYNIYL